MIWLAEETHDKDKVGKVTFRLVCVRARTTQLMKMHDSCMLFDLPLCLLEAHDAVVRRVSTEGGNTRSRTTWS